MSQPAGNRHCSYLLCDRSRFPRGISSGEEAGGEGPAEMMAVAFEQKPALAGGTGRVKAGDRRQPFTRQNRELLNPVSLAGRPRRDPGRSTTGDAV
jgi:hypothetical protein